MTAIPSSSALQVTDFKKDKDAPQLMTFELDLNLGRITLSFDEIVVGSTVDSLKYILQNETSDNPAESVPLESKPITGEGSTLRLELHSRH